MTEEPLEVESITETSSGLGEVARASSVMAVGTMASRVTGLLRDAALGAAIGTAVLGDTFAVANTIPNTVYALLAGGAITAVFVPQLVRHLHEDDDGGEVYTQRLLTLATLTLVAVTAAAVALAPFVVRLFATSTWTTRDFHVATLFALLCLPQILFYGLYTMFQQVLNARGHFAAPMFAPIINNVVVMVTCGLFIAAAHGSTLTTGTISGGELALLGAGSTLGIAAQALVLLPVMRRTGFRWRPRFDFRNAGLGKAGTLASWTFVFVLTNTFALVVISRLATKANVLASAAHLATSAGLVTYQRANLAFQLPQSVITVSVVTALLPRMSAKAIARNLSGVADDVTAGLRLALVGVVPATAALLVLAPPIGVVAFNWGSTSTGDARVIGEVAQFFVLGLIPFTAFFVLLRGFYALEDTRTPALVNIVLNAVNIAVAYTLFELVSVTHKVQSLAAAYLPTYAIAAVLTWLLLSRRLGGLPAYLTIRTAVRLIVAVLPATALMWAASTASTDLLGTGRLGSLVAVVLALSLGSGAFLLLARRLRVEEAGQLMATVRGRLTR